MEAQRQARRDDSIWWRLWAAWKRFAHRVGEIQARILLTVFYFVILAPFALLVRMTADPLTLRPGSAGGWRPHVQGPLESSKRALSQF